MLCTTMTKKHAIVQSVFPMHSSQGMTGGCGLGGAYDHINLVSALLPPSLTSQTLIGGMQVWPARL